MGVRDYFAGKNIFLTGGSGFVGKALIEKLLRSCPEVGNIYILMRHKKGKTPQERWNLITENRLFDKLRESNVESFKKVIAIEGDILELGLGLSEQDRMTLTQNVNIIYHVAASVRFDDPLKHAIFVNVRSTRDIIEIAKEITHLEVFVHVSTTYCNCDKLEVDEVIYPSHGNWRDAIKIAEEADTAIVDSLTQKYIDPLPNTYTYCKSLAEHVVVDLCKGQIPAIIVRPSIVVSAKCEPIEGWSDNLNGPFGLLAAGGKGLLRICWGNWDVNQDYVSIDAVIKVILVATFEKQKLRNLDEVEVYNASKYNYAPFSLGLLIRLGERLIHDTPLSQMLWYPRFSITRCWYNFYIQVLLFHMLPALFLDVLLRIAGKKPIVFKIQRKIYIANVVLELFMRHTWDFSNKRTVELFENISPEDKTDFDIMHYFHITTEEIYQYFRNSKIVISEIIFNEDFTDIERNRRNLFRLWLIDVFVKIIFFSLLFWFLFIKNDLFNYVAVAANVRNYFQKL